MSQYSWAEKEIEAACKIENEYDVLFLNYNVECYKSALKAFKALCDDEHSDFSMTKTVLKRLLDGLPLSPITDNDFICDNDVHYDKEYLEENSLKSDIQCSRRSSLFRREYLDGKVEYKDIDRYYCVDAENPSIVFKADYTNIIDELYPIEMPYMPSSNKFKVYTKRYITSDGLDIVEYIGFSIPNGTWYFYPKSVVLCKNGKLRDLSYEDARRYTKERTTTLHNKSIDRMLDYILDYCEDNYINISKPLINSFKSKLEKCIDYLLCTDSHGIYYLNTDENYDTIVNGNIEEKTMLVKQYDRIQELINVVDDIKAEIIKIASN